MHSKKEQQTFTKQSQNHEVPLKKHGHVTQPAVNSNRCVKSSYHTSPNLPSFSFPKNNSDVQYNRQGLHSNKNQLNVSKSNRNNLKTGGSVGKTSNFKKQIDFTQGLYKKCGHVNKNVANWMNNNKIFSKGINNNVMQLQKSTVSDMYKTYPHTNRTIPNMNAVAKTGTAVQNSTTVAAKKVNTPGNSKLLIKENTLNGQPHNANNDSNQQNKSNALGTNEQNTKCKDTKNSALNGTTSNTPQKQKNDITEIYKRAADPIQKSCNTTIQKSCNTTKVINSVPPNTENLTFQKVTQELANIIKNFQKQIHDVPLSRATMEQVPSAMIQPKIKEFFKNAKPIPSSATNSSNGNKNQSPNNSSNKNQDSNNSSNKNKTSSNSRIFNDVNKQSSLRNFPRTSDSSRTNDVRRFSSFTHHTLASRSSSSSRRGFSYLNIDPLKQLRDEVHKAIRERKTFTVRGQFGPIRRALLSRGWIEKFHISYKDQLHEDFKRYQNYSISELLPLMRREDLTSTCKNLIKSKLLGGYQVDFYWGTNDEAFKENPDKIKLTTINKLKREIFSYTNKQGLCDASKSSYWYQKSNVSKLNHPRSYSLGKNGDVKSFVDDFNITAAMSLLKWVVKINETKESKLVSPIGKIPLETFDFALNECCKFIKKGKHEDIDTQICEATEHEWNQFLDYFYKLVHYSNHFKAEGTETEDSLVRKSNYILNNLKSFYPFVEMDGMMNIWILKPTASSRGRGIHMCRTLQYALKVIKQNSNIRYIIQKYIERPLLIYNTKFDIRQWFLISNCSPLTIWMYKECYLRFSSQTYNLRKLHESIHLTNNSVQRKYKNNSLDAALPTYNMWDSADFQKYLTNIGYPDAFKKIVYPGMKQCITAAVLMHQDKMVVRRNCFELYGADFILTEDFQPWLLEINSNPALYGSTPITARMCPKVLEDVIKVVIDYAHNSKATTGAFEMIYKEQMLKLPAAATLELKGLPLQNSYFFNAPDPELDNSFELPRINYKSTVVDQTQDCLKIFGEEIKKTLKNLLQIIHNEKQKRGLKQQPIQNKTTNCAS